MQESAGFEEQQEELVAPVQEVGRRRQRIQSDTVEDGELESLCIVAVCLACIFRVGCLHNALGFLIVASNFPVYRCESYLSISCHVITYDILCF